MASSDSEAVKILEVTKVFPYPTNKTRFSLPLTFFDIMWFQEPPVSIVFFYQIPDLKSNTFNSLILPKLKISLSHTLHHFFPIAGNLTWPSQDGAKPTINYAPSEDGVCFTVAESTNISAHDFNCLSGDGPFDAIGLHPLVPPMVSSDDAAALLALQITLYPSQGFCIGLTHHHGILDAKCVSNFVISWSYLCKLPGNNQENKSPSLPTNLVPNFNGIKDPLRLDELYLDQLLQQSKSKSLKISQNLGDLRRDLVRATFKLTRNEIVKLREFVSAQTSQIPHLSTFVLTLAHVITCLVRSKGGEEQRNVLCSFAVDYRKRLDPPASKNHFGNCVGICDLQPARAGDFMDDENGLVFAAKLIGDGMKGIGTFEMDREVQKKYIYDFIYLGRSESEGQIITVSGSPKIDFYGSDFGWGRPKKVQIVSIDRTGAVSLFERGDGSGEIEIGLALEKQEMERFASLFHTELRKMLHRRSVL